MTNFPEKIASAPMESIMAAFRTEAADLQRLADEVNAAGQDVEKIRAAIERHGADGNAGHRDIGRRAGTVGKIRVNQGPAAGWRRAVR